MKYVDEFRNIKLARKLALKIEEIMPRGNINIMEVCGSHTQSFYRFGIDKLLPKGLRLISGPGCPVCVSPQEYIDAAIELANNRNNIILSFGDMLRVPGSKSTLEKARAGGANISMAYSAFETIKVAKKNPQKKVVFLAVGFETTAPTIALSILQAKKEKINNLFFLSSLKLIPPAMQHLLNDPELKIDAFLCPGHVSSIIGAKAYEFIPKKYSLGCCVTGFEPVDILEGLYFLLRQIVRKKPKAENQYIRAVTRNGNLKAQKIIKQVFAIADTNWRGLGVIPKSGLKIRDEFSKFDAERNFRIRHMTHDTRHMTQCRCADVIKGLIRPKECKLFRKACTPENPYGPCMVSQEGACNAYYKYL